VDGEDPGLIKAVDQLLEDIEGWTS